MNRAAGNNVGASIAPTSKSFIQDTVERLGVSPSTVKSQVRAAKNTIPEAREIIRESGVVVSKMDAVRLSQLEPEQQKEAASRLASGTIRSLKEFCEDDSQPEVPQMTGDIRDALDTFKDKIGKGLGIILEFFPD